MKKKEEEKKIWLNKVIISKANLNSIPVSTIMGRDGLPCPPPSEYNYPCGVKFEGVMT